MVLGLEIIFSFLFFSECFDNFVGVLVICVLVFTVVCIVCTVFLYCFVYVYLLLFVTKVRTTATELQS